MENHIIWLLIGFGLMIVELLTGTFYLLVLGIAAFGGAAAGWFGQGFPAQIIITAVVATIGSWMVHAYRARNALRQMKPIDFAKPVIFEKWVDQKERMARVRYRDASWEAQVEAGAEVEPGGTLYILAADGNTFRVAKTRPDWKQQ
jgi:membrane protein implicated in regulation of membrane protease activity